MKHSDLKRKVWTCLWLCVAGASFSVNIAAIAITKSIVMIVAGVIALVTSTVVVQEQVKLQDRDIIRKVQMKLQEEMKRLVVENEKLHGEITKLEVQVVRLKEQEEKLEEITKRQGSNVASLVELVKENREVNEQLKIVVNAETVQILVAAIIDSDIDSSGTFSDQELRVLEVRMSNLPGISVDTEEFKQRVTMGDRQLSTVLSLFLDVERDNVPDEKRIFRVTPDKLIERKTNETPMYAHDVACSPMPCCL